MLFKERFRGFLPVVLDVETAGVNSTKNPLLELAIVLLDWHDDRLTCGDSFNWAVAPHEGAEIDQSAIAMHQIDPYDSDRQAQSEETCLRKCFGIVRKKIREVECNRALIVGHNAHFDRKFLHAAIYRCKIKRDPFHLFTVIDTASLAALVYGHTVLSVACSRAGIAYDRDQAHSALYDAEVTAQLFCKIVNEVPYVPIWENES